MQIQRGHNVHIRIDFPCSQSEFFHHLYVSLRNESLIVNLNIFKVVRRWVSVSYTASPPLSVGRSVYILNKIANIFGSLVHTHAYDALCTDRLGKLQHFYKGKAVSSIRRKTATISYTAFVDGAKHFLPTIIMRVCATIYHRTIVSYRLNALAFENIYKVFSKRITICSSPFAWL